MFDYFIDFINGTIREKVSLLSIFCCVYILTVHTDTYQGDQRGRTHDNQWLHTTMITIVANGK